MTLPDFWLVFAIEWPDNRRDVNECLVAVAPQQIPRGVLGPHTDAVLDQAEAYFADTNRPVVLFADVTSRVTKLETSWDELGVDWSGALNVLEHNPTITRTRLFASYEAYMLASTNSAVMVMVGRGGRQEQTDARFQRSIVRANLANELKKAWA